jgi:hypothetical protein
MYNNQVQDSNDNNDIEMTKQELDAKVTSGMGGGGGL